MYEITVALKYLIPRWRQLSVSIISLISVLVVSLVVWLILVFFSVTNGLEKSWIEKLVAITSPVRVTPSQDYYESYYYRIDSSAESSDYSLKTVSEKLASDRSNPYDPEIDPPLPPRFPTPDFDSKGEYKDIVKRAYAALSSVKGIDGLQVKEFENTMATVHLDMQRDGGKSLSQQLFLGSFDPGNRDLRNNLQELHSDDVDNLVHLKEPSADKIPVTQWKTPETGWTLPKEMLPDGAAVAAVAALKGRRIVQVLIPENRASLQPLFESWQKGWKGDVLIGSVQRGGRDVIFTAQDQSLKRPLGKAPIFIPGDIAVEKALEGALQLTLQNMRLSGKCASDGLNVSLFKIPESTDEIKPCWVHSKNLIDGTVATVLPRSSDRKRDGLILPKTYRDAGVLIGDRGHIAYSSPTASTIQEQRLPIFVAGFYDQGVMSFGGRFAWVDKEVVGIINSAYDQSENPMLSGFHVRFDHYLDAEKVKGAILAALEKEEVGNYWNVETFRDFPYTKEILKQISSEKNLFSLISIVIILVACSNIVSMQTILVNDKKMEIGILRAMGASSTSIALIFGLCGMAMGMAGSLIGTVLAVITLKNIELLIHLISKAQGHELFNEMFYGDMIPNQLSNEALFFVMATTVIVSLVAGIVPAVKASLMKPSAIMRAE